VLDVGPYASVVDELSQTLQADVIGLDGDACKAAAGCLGHGGELGIGPLDGGQQQPTGTKAAQGAEAVVPPTKSKTTSMS
jgi:hypothetical protein